jgi:[glutamine synthetase] adenylyltransferase / [glutamine synthetase]-adenylyl-L-tyrosine phosphorylase
MAEPQPASNDVPLAQAIRRAPLVHDQVRAERALSELAAHPATTALLRRADLRGLLAGIFGASPFLTAVATRDPARLARCLTEPPGEQLTRLSATLLHAAETVTTLSEMMVPLRIYKAELALLTALADCAGVWPVMQVAEVLSDAADTALTAAVRFLFLKAVRAGQWLDTAPQPDSRSGYIVLAMGKHGGRELNYSSDIDLIIFYDAERGHLPAGVDPQGFMVRLTRDLVRLMQEPTADGYVFRTDLRLRPDPGSTQIALSRDAALGYYESFGQNWERAALIKARAVAGDLEAGREFLAELGPYIWRKYLDFAAIADIHAMKRQIHAVKGFDQVRVAGHNIKLGRGGIREIEFFAQTQQLIAGGRQPDLRVPRTLDALQQLERRGWIVQVVTAELSAAYEHLRMVEHRLQMIADEQTQTLPEAPEKLLQLARFCGYADVAAFDTVLRGTLQTVQRHYGALFEGSAGLTAGAGNLVFVGAIDDPATLETLTRLGYADPSSAIAIVKGWHFGRYAAMRSARARERLTEVQPALLRVLGQSGDANASLAAFDRFLAELPAGVQLFSMVRSNPKLLELLAAIMGTAPRLAQLLSRRPRLLEAVLDPNLFGALPASDDLDATVAHTVSPGLTGAADFADTLDRARIIGNEQSFLIGVRVLTDTITSAQAGSAYASLAESLVRELNRAVTADCVRQHGAVDQGASVVLAMGKLGSREMAANSDLDLIVVYDYAAGATTSNGPKPLAAQHYYARLTQRLVSALSVPTAEGRLYDVDMRLRPSGSSGPVATHLQSFTDYQHATAWTWEHMALTRARVVAGPPALAAAVTSVVHAVLTAPRDRDKTRADAAEMRQRLVDAKGTTALWDLKHVRGGLVDIEFIAQYLQLVSAHQAPEVLHPTTQEALERLARVQALTSADAQVLLPALHLYQSVSQILRLCVDGAFDARAAPTGLAARLARAGGMPDLIRLEAMLIETQAAVADVFDQIIGP